MAVQKTSFYIAVPLLMAFVSSSNACAGNIATLTLHLNSKISMAGELTFKYGMRYGGTSQMGKSSIVSKKYKVKIKKPKGHRQGYYRLSLDLDLRTLPKSRPVDGEVLFSLTNKSQSYQDFVVAKIWLRKCGSGLCSNSYRIYLPVANYGTDDIYKTCIVSRDSATSQKSLTRVFAICQKSFQKPSGITPNDQLRAGTGWQDSTAKLVNNFNHQNGANRNESKFRLDDDSERSLRAFRDIHAPNDGYFRKVTKTDDQFTRRWNKAKKKNDETIQRATGTSPAKSNSNLVSRLGK